MLVKGIVLVGDAVLVGDFAWLVKDVVLADDFYGEHYCKNGQSYIDGKHIGMASIKIGSAC